MSVYRRRYDRNEIIKLMFDTSFRMKEQNKFVLALDDDLIKEDLITFFNFIVLCCVKNYRENFFDRNTCLRIIDKADGYLFAFDEDLIDKNNLYQKFRRIMEDDLFVREWNYKVIYEEVEDDNNKSR